MKTLKHLAIVALVCYAASSFAGAVVSDLEKEYQTAENYLQSGMHQKAHDTAQSVIDQADELVQPGTTLTDDEINEVVDIMTKAQNLQNSLPRNFAN